MCASRELSAIAVVDWLLPDGNLLFYADKKKKTEHQTSIDDDDDVDENASTNSQLITSAVHMVKSCNDSSQRNVHRYCAVCVSRAKNLSAYATNQVNCNLFPHSFFCSSLSSRRRSPLSLPVYFMYNKCTIKCASCMSNVRNIGSSLLSDCNGNESGFLLAVGDRVQPVCRT